MLTYPHDLYGRRRRDPAFRLLGALSEAILAAAAADRWSADDVRSVDRGRPMRVVDKPLLAHDVVGVVLEHTNGRKPVAWSPGSHLDLTLPSGLRRQYSLCGSDPDQLMVAVRRIGAASTEIHDQVRPGDVLQVQGPRTAFPFCHEQKVLLVAGGIGITPIITMARECAAHDLDWHLVYAGRSRESMPFLDELVALGGPRVTTLVDTERNRRPVANELLAWADTDTAVYCCGPTPLLDLVRRARDRVRAPLHYERFAPPPVVDGRAFELTLARSHRTLHVPADRSALDVVLDTVPHTPHSCRQGFCGTCRVRVCEGEFERRGHASGPGRPGDRDMLLCIDRAADERIEVDL